MHVVENKFDKEDFYEKRLSQYDLTNRQKQVALLLLTAKTRRQIAGELKLSESTIKMHVGELYKKLGINSRAELFLLFYTEESAQIK